MIQDVLKKFPTEYSEDFENKIKDILIDYGFEKVDFVKNDDWSLTAIASCEYNNIGKIVLYINP